MDYIFRISRISFIFAVFLFSAISIAVQFQDLASGEHSYRKLGDDYYVEIPMQHIQGKPKLVLYNSRLADSLGLPKLNSEELKKTILDLFALQVDKSQKSNLKMIATRYQDSPEKSAGEALGDGRAVWAGEIKTITPAGKIEYYDVVLKGIGQTPLAWLNHPDIRHKDGLQSIEEAVHSFVYSEANVRNGIDTTVDLAVIELPIQRSQQEEGTTKAAVTVRIGKQTRLAHLRYFKDDPKKFNQIFHYIVRRDLGLPLNAKVGTEEVEKYIKQFNHNLALEAARYYDLHAVHGSPTLGNLTTTAGTIDYGTFRYLDAHHSHYTYFFNRLELGGQYSQTRQLLNYQTNLLTYLEEAKYPLPKTLWHYRKELEDNFWNIFEDTTSRLFLKRLGIPQNKIADISEDEILHFGRSVRVLNELEGTQEVLAGKEKKLPAAFDIRKILSSSLSVFLENSPKQSQLWENVFNNERTWSSQSKSANVLHAKSEYIFNLKNIINDLEPTNEELKSWITNANKIAEHLRIAPGPNFYYKDEKYAASKNVLTAIANDEDFESINQKGAQAIESLVDNGLFQIDEIPKLECLKVYGKLTYP